MLEMLPTEVLRMILAEFNITSDLLNVCRVSKMLYNATIPLLYETVNLETNEEALKDFHQRDFHEVSKVHLMHTKRLHISAPFHDILRDRCPDNDDDGLEVLLEDSENDDTNINKLGKSLLPLLYGLTDGHLREFSWHLGICVPKVILGPGGYLAERQIHIESLSLITDCDCLYYLRRDSFMDLSNFKSIRLFSWIGLRSFQDFTTLHHCLEGNATQLESLTLDLLDWEDAEIMWKQNNEGRLVRDSPNFFARDILKIEKGRGKTSFPSLQNLSLSGVSFQAAANDMAHALNFGNLRKLKLCSCPQVLDLLNKILQSNMSLRLTSFELVVAEHILDFYENFDVTHLNKFLSAFSGLKDLYMLMPGPQDWGLLTQAVVNHGRTLTRFVLHSRIHVDDEEEPRDCPLVDWYPMYENLLLLPKLECVGLCIDIPFLMSKLEMFKDKPSLKILHIRASGSSDLEVGGFRSNEATEEDMEQIREAMEQTREAMEETKEAIERTQEILKGVKEAAEQAKQIMDQTVEDMREVMKKTNAHNISVIDHNHEADRDASSSSSIAKVEIGRQPSLSPVAEELIEPENMPEPPPDLAHFAQWAFGPTGLQELQILAHGDFSHKGRYAKHNILLCRNEAVTKHLTAVSLDSNQSNLTFRKMSKDDRSLADLVSLHTDFLEACAVDHIFDL